jgi:tetratricopeptide (TPR) repeat protein
MKILWLLLFAGTLSLPFFSGGQRAYAHVAADMPDPIAEVEYQMMLDFEPDDSTTRYKLAMVYYRLNKDAKAEAELAKVLKADPFNFHALEGMGALKLRQENFAAAVTYLTKAIQQNEKVSGAYYYLGLAKTGIADLAGAKEAFATGLEKCRAEEESNREIPLEQFREALGPRNL